MPIVGHPGETTNVIDDTRGGVSAVRASPGVHVYFVGAFAATYDETPIRYLTRRRIERAQDPLRHANLTVTEVCLLVRPYGVEAVIRDDSGNWLVLVEMTEFTAADFE